LKNLNVQLLAISPDQPSKLKETIDKHKMGFVLLSDSDMIAARSFRVAYKLDDATLAELKKYNIDVEEASVRVREPRLQGSAGSRPAISRREDYVGRLGLVARRRRIPPKH
jgi:hypothetical protein